MNGNIKLNDDDPAVYASPFSKHRSTSPGSAPTCYDGHQTDLPTRCRPTSDASCRRRMERGSMVGWPSSTSMMMFPTGPRSMYMGRVYGGSEYGGFTSGWTTGSVYAGGFGPSQPNKTSAMIRNYQQNGPSASRDSRLDPPHKHFGPYPLPTQFSYG